MKTTNWDVTEHLDTPQAIAGYLEAVMEDGDPRLLVAALGDVARAKGMAAIAESAGLSRESLYRSLRDGSHAEFATIWKVVKALDLSFRISPNDERPSGSDGSPPSVDRPTGTPGNRAA